LLIFHTYKYIFLAKTDWNPLPILRLRLWENLTRLASSRLMLPVSVPPATYLWGMIRDGYNNEHTEN